MVVSSLSHTVTVEVEHATRDAAGRVRQDWTPLVDASNNTLTFVGPLAQAGAAETSMWGQQQHDVIFSLMVPGLRYPDAKPGDRFRDELGRLYYIRGIDDTSSNGRWTIYYTSLSPSGA